MSRKFFRFAMLSILLAALAMFQANAAPVSADQAKVVAQNWIDYVVRHDSGWGQFQDAEAVSLEPFFVDGTVVGYVIHVAPLGYVIVPSEDELPPVKAFSTDGMFIPGAYGFPDWLGAELREFVTTLRNESSSKPVFDPINRELWDRFEKNYQGESVPFTSAALLPNLTTTTWDQVDPYNRFCPEVNGEKCPVGCVATAAAQVMKYWNWPPQGTGTHSYSWRGQTLSADFNHTYDWANMLDSYNFGATNAQKDEVARLSSDLGIAFNMDYDPSGSGAYTTDAVQILPAYFYYSSQIQSSEYVGNDQDWFDEFREEVDAGRPTLMSIRGTAGGHAIVCDGYRTDTGNMLHLNMGWGGSGNAYYAVNNIVVMGMDFTWVDWQQIVKNIAPNETRPVACASSATPMGGKAPVTVSFAAIGKKGVSPFTYGWDFGDGTTGTGQFTTHVFQNAGAYTVTLTVTDSTSQTATDSHLQINVTGSTGLSAASQASVTSGKAPLSVTFTAVAQGGVPPYSYTWVYGDGGSETTSNATVTHTYTQAGSYTAVLTAKDSVGAQSTAAGITISVQPSTPVPQITSVSKLTSPFRLKVLGSNFISSSIVKINGTAVPTTYKSGGKLLATGSTVKALCPKGVEVTITVENEAGNVSNEYKFKR